MKHLNLEPGEGGAMDIRLPPEIVRRLKAGGRLDIRNGPVERDPQSYLRRVFVKVDGEPMGAFLVRWQGDEACVAVVPDGESFVAIMPEGGET